jgi:NAD(P)-dependent dehydrogenase (short-subunit alcohol dehydrogenase family)
MSWLQLTGKTAIVTGAASGIGRAVVQGLVDAGCCVVAGDVQGVEQRFAHDYSAAAGVSVMVHPVTCNVTSRAQVQELIRAGDTFSAPASILVNCAGITRDSFVTNMEDRDWDQVLDVNLKGTFLLCQEFLSAERALHGGSIINVGSVVSEKGNMGQANYAASVSVCVLYCVCSDLRCVQPLVLPLLSIRFFYCVSLCRRVASSV